MELTTSRSANAAVVSVSGRVDSLVAMDFEKGLVGALQEAGGSLVLDCAELHYISSAGLRALLVAIKKANAAGGELFLCRVSPRIREVLDVSGFTRFTKLFDAVADAAAGLSSGA